MSPVDTGVAQYATTGLRRMGEQPSLGAYLREIWDRRHFLVTLTSADLRAQNQDTVLGRLWHLLNPLFLAGVFLLVFGVVLDIGRGVTNYPAFLVTGIFTFFYVQKPAMTGTRTIVANTRLIQSLSFPRAILPGSAVATEAGNQITALVALVVLVGTTGVAPRLSWLMIVPVFLVQTLFSMGLAFFTARLTFHFRDTAQVLPYAMRIWLYLSGIFFSASQVGDPDSLIGTVFRLNPAYLFIKLNRLAMLHGTPDAAGSISDGVPYATTWWLALAWTVVAFVGGFLFFRAREMDYSRG